LKLLRPFIYTVVFLFLMVSLYSQVKKFQPEDTDKDGIPDFLEVATGYNPKINECALKKCKINLNGINQKEYFVIILDQSSSMAESLNTQKTKMEGAKDAIRNFVKSLPLYIQVGMFTYGKESCSPLDEVHSPFEIGGRRRILSQLEEIEPSGATPIAASLAAFRELIQDKKGRFHVLLVTDGVESCDGDPIEEAKKLIALNDLHLGVNLSVVGLGVNQKEAKELIKIAQASNGKYYSINKEEEFQKLFQTPLEEMIENYKEMVCLQVEVDKLIHCETQRMNRIILQSNSSSSNFSIEEKNYLKNNLPKLQEKMQSKIDVYSQFKIIGTNKLQERINELSKLLPPNK